MHAATHFIGRLGWRGIGLLAAAIMLVAAVVVGTSTADSQSPPPHRFFGFAGDVTIDGAAIEAGVEVVAMIDGEAAATGVVSNAGSWFLDIPVADLDEPCNVTFVVDGIDADQTWTVCPMRVKLDLTSEAKTGDDDMMSEDDGDSMMEGDADDTMEEDDLLEADDSDGDTMEADDTAAVTPAVPGTGTGGLLGDGDGSPWASAVAITALLMFGVAAVALLIGRRTDSVR